MASGTYCNDLPTGWESNACAEELAGVVAVGYIHNSVFPMADPEDNAEWTTDIANGDTIVIYNTKGDYPGEEFTEEDEGFGLADGRTTGATHTVNWQTIGVNVESGGAAVNIENADRLNKAQGQYYFFLVTSNLDLRISTKPVRSKIQDVIPESKKDDQVFQAVVTWTDFNKMDRYDAPLVTYTDPSP